MLAHKNGVKEPPAAAMPGSELSSKTAFIQCLEKTLEFADEEDFAHCVERAIETVGP
ncbi:MAG: hypothetical protein R6U17_03170 [Thermoplasmata archaeon]